MKRRTNLAIVTPDTERQPQTLAQRLAAILAEYSEVLYSAPYREVEALKAQLAEYNEHLEDAVTLYEALEEL
jgi:hypothetical protein